VVNCWQNHSSYRALFRILEQLGRTVDVHRQSTPQDVLPRPCSQRRPHPLQSIATVLLPACVVVVSGIGE
jgi:hypothetical protein